MVYADSVKGDTMPITVFSILLFWGFQAIGKKEKLWGLCAWICLFFAAAGIWILQDASTTGFALMGAAYAAYVICGISRQITQNHLDALISERGIKPGKSALHDILVGPDEKQK